MSNPIIIGATGGSGTRAIQMIVAAQDIFMGAPLNAEKDALIIAEFLEHHINPVLRHTRSLNYHLKDLPETLRNSTLSALESAMQKMLAHKPENQLRWGFKNPRSIFMLPFFEALYPDFTFVHVIRDGRDIALSENKNQPLKHFEAAFPESAILPASPEAAILLWAKVNHEAAAWCAQQKKRYVRVHYEALCDTPEAEVKKMFSALQITQKETTQTKEIIKKSSGTGRWKNLPASQVSVLNRAADQALREFLYIA